MGILIRLGLLFSVLFVAYVISRTFKLKNIYFISAIVAFVLSFFLPYEAFLQTLSVASLLVGIVHYVKGK